MITDAVNANQLVSELIVEELVRLGVSTFFVSPGSRSAPLAVAAARHPQTVCYVHFDERGSAFAALGFGRAAASPAAWITTSGTAVANGLPAVVEASLDGIPLIALTADRPPELRRTGSNQTIDQPDIFGNYTRWRFDLAPAAPSLRTNFVLTTVDQAVHRAIGDAGPVHLNCMFREPLAPAEDESFRLAIEPALSRWLASKQPYTTYHGAHPVLAPDYVDVLAELCDPNQPGLVIAGRLRSEAEGAAVADVARRLRWPLIPDILSFASRSADVGAIGHFDLLLACDAVRAEMRPRTVLHFGGRATSKRLYQHFENSPPDRFVLVSPLRDRIDPVHIVTHRIEAGVPVVCRQILDAVSERSRRSDASEFAHRLQNLESSVDGILDDRLGAESHISEPFVARHLARSLPPDHGLFLGSSMPIRDVDSFAPSSRRLPAWANRGASGIDGTVASAVGVALGRQRGVTVLLGDLALLHDLNSLSLVKNCPHPVVIVVINNDGGGIFSFLPISEYPEVFEEYFGTPHGLGFGDVAKMFNLPYHSTSDSATFVSAYAELCSSRESGLIEVFTDRRENRALHDDLIEAISAVATESTLQEPSASN